MRKLFTLIALFACFLGAKAVEFTDFTVDYTQAGKSTIGWKADVIQDDWITADGEGLHLYNPAVTTNFYDYQLWIFNGANLDVDQNYTIKIVAKVSDGSATVRCRVGDWGGGISGDVVVNSTNYQEYTLTGAATVSNSGLLVQFGDYVGTVSFKSITITHEGKEQRPVNWIPMIQNGDAEGEFGEVACFQSKEWNPDPEKAANIHPAEITTVDGSKVFVCHSKAVNPPLAWDSDGEQWGQQHKAGDPKPDNAWQNQVWITLPRALKADEQIKISFRYKASKAVRADLQTHREPSDYLGGFTPDRVNFTTDWQNFEQVFSAPADMKSLAFNLGAEVYTEDIDFYFDDVVVAEMELEKGYFVASTNTESGLVEYDYDTATKFELDDDVYVATVGTKGKKETWVNEVMISTVRGNDKAFKAATLKLKKAVKNDKKYWIDFEAGSSAKIKLSAAGVWTISIDPEGNQMNFVKLEGEADKEPIVVKPNPTKVVVNAVEREYTDEKEAPEGYEFKKNEKGENIVGYAWDNQFFIVANRALDKDEETVIQFKYKSSVADAKVTVQSHGEPGAFIGGAWDAMTFQPTEQTFPEATEESAFFEFKIPSNGVKTIAFNMAEIKGACDYEIYDVVWKLKDETESLIDQTGSKNFFVKIGAGTNPYQFGTDPTGIENVVSKSKASNATFNIAGQRVSKDFKGLVIKNGSKYLVK
jgi:hypothetical protein